MAFEGLSLRNELQIQEIITIHYFEYSNTYSFSGESHDFWEFMCVDKGEVLVQAGTENHLLASGQIIFHKPNEFHSLHANGRTAPNLAVISFVCSSPCMRKLEGMITSIDEKERSLLAMIIHEARQCIATPLNDPRTQRMLRKSKAPFGSEQMIRLNLEMFLLSLIRRAEQHKLPAPAVKSVKQKSDELFFAEITAYMEAHIRERLTLDKICRANMIGRAQLLKLFRSKGHGGVIDYFCWLKIETAKRMIREDSGNFSQIADYLGYSSIHYFSRQFKKVAGMTPSEYASSIKALAERPEPF